MLSAIFAVGAFNEFGYQGGMPWGMQQKTDLKRFRQVTQGKRLLCGSATMKTLPSLPGRTVVSFSRNDTLDDSDYLVIGGAKLLSIVHPLVNQVYVTVVLNSQVLPHDVLGPVGYPMLPPRLLPALAALCVPVENYKGWRISPVQVVPASKTDLYPTAFYEMTRL